MQCILPKLRSISEGIVYTEVAKMTADGMDRSSCKLDLSGTAIGVNREAQNSKQHTRWSQENGL